MAISFTVVRQGDGSKWQVVYQLFSHQKAAQQQPKAALQMVTVSYLVSCSTGSKKQKVTSFMVVRKQQDADSEIVF